MSLNFPTNAAALAADARNRALRTFIQNIVIDVAVAAVMVLVAAFGKAESWGDFEWSLLSFTMGKTAVVTAGSYVMRKFLDPARSIPTPLPPENPGEPAE